MEKATNSKQKQQTPLTASAQQLLDELAQQPLEEISSVITLIQIREKVIMEGRQYFSRSVPVKEVVKQHPSVFYLRLDPFPVYEMSNKLIAHDKQTYLHRAVELSTKIDFFEELEITGVKIFLDDMSVYFKVGQLTSFDLELTNTLIHLQERGAQANQEGGYHKLCQVVVFFSAVICGFLGAGHYKLHIRKSKTN